MYKGVKDNKPIWCYMEDLALHNIAPTLHWEESTRFISVVEAKTITPRVKHIDITVCFLQKQFDNGIFIIKYNKYSVMKEYMCTKPCSGPNQLD